MGIRGELFSTRYTCEGRTYFFNVKQNRNGDVFLSIVESKPGEGESFDRRSIIVFGEHMEGFLKSFQSALRFIDKNGIKVEPAQDDRGFPMEDDDRPRRQTSDRGKQDFPHGRRADFRERSKDERYQRPARPDAREQSRAPRDASPRRASPRDDARKPAGGFGFDRSAGERRPSYPKESAGGEKPVKRIVVRKPRKAKED